MKAQYLLSVCVILGTHLITTAQVKIGDNPTTINNSALLELESSDKGILISRMTEAQKNAIVSPATGLLIYQMDGSSGFYYYTGSVWQNMIDNQAIYAHLSDSLEQQPTTTDPTAVSFTTNDEINGISHTAGGSTITILTAGVYNLMVQPLVTRTGSSGTAVFHCWLQVDTGSGWTNLPNSNRKLDIPNLNQDDVIVLSLIHYFNSNDTVRVMISTSDVSKEVRLHPHLNITNEPNIPSIIFTMNKI